MGTCQNTEFPPINAGELLTTEQAAKIYGLSQSTLRKWRCVGNGPRFTRIGRAVRYRRAELDAFVEGRTFGSTTQADCAVARRVKT